MKYRIEKDSPQETLLIPLLGRKVCSERYPDLFLDPEAARICGMIDYDFSQKQKLMETQAGLFGALEVAQRQYDLLWEVKNYLASRPKAAVVNLGCGLDDTFRKADNGLCRGYNIDLPDVIAVRNELLPAGARERNLAFDLTDDAWMDAVDGSDGAVFFASGVFYYLRTEQVRTLLDKLARRFPGAVIAFDCCNRRGAKMMTKTWIKAAGIKDVDALFSLDEPASIGAWSGAFRAVGVKSYMRGYRDIYPRVNPLHKLMIRFCDSLVRMVVIRIECA